MAPNSAWKLLIFSLLAVAVGLYLSFRPGEPTMLAARPELPEDERPSGPP